LKKGRKGDGVKKEGDDLIESSFVSGSSFLKRFLGYSAVSQTLQKSQEIYHKAKTSSKLLGYSFDKVETSVQLIMDSQIGKFVDTKINVIYDKLSVNERGNMLLDIVEEKTESVIETAKPYYEQGKDIVEKKKEKIVQTAKPLYEQGKDIVEKKKEIIVQTAKPYYDQGKDIVEKKKEKIVRLYTWGKNSLIEKSIDPKVIKEQVVNLYTKGKTTLEEKNKAIKEDANKFITACQNQKEATKQKGLEYYNQTCKYAEAAKQKSFEYIAHQKETVKQTSLTYYKLATEYIKQGQKYLLSAMEKKSSPKSKDTQDGPSKAKLLFNKTKEDLSNATHKFYDALHQLKDNLLTIKKNGINITINALK